MSNNSTSETNSTDSANLLKSLVTLADLYHYLDDLFEQDSDSDILFAGGYLRGLGSLVATDFGDESQLLSTNLLQAITTKIDSAKSELTPQDFAIVKNFWLKIQSQIA